MNAASSETVVGLAEDLIEGAAPGLVDRKITRFWFSHGELINVVARVGGRPLEFKVSGGEQLLWIGEPGGVSATPTAPPSHAVSISFEALPEVVAERVVALVPDFVATSVFSIEARDTYYQLRGDSIHGRVFLTIKANGVVTEFGTDLDRDGLVDAFELQNGWNPEMRDTDGDGFPDGFEFDHDGDPGVAEVHPQMLSIRFDRETNMLIAMVETFEGPAFFVESQGADGEWRRVGPSLAGIDGAREFAIPLAGPSGTTVMNGLLRAGFTENEDGEDGTAGGPVDSDSCSVPDSLVGMEMTVGGGRRLCFKSKNRGEEISGSGGAMLVTSFGYVFKKSGHCKARLTLTFNTGAGFETTVYILTFGTDGRPGAFAASNYEEGSKAGSFDGVFTMNP